jgi:phosphatidylinositol alpha-1,6-mannosyltransferase
MGGGIARWMAELARAYPPGGLVVSTGAWRGGAESDQALPQRVDRLTLNANRLKTLQGVLRWSHRVARLTRSTSAEFIWCGNLKPAAYPALWVHRRQGVPYSVIFHGTDLLKLQHKVKASAVKRRSATMLLRSAAVLVANSRWTGDLCRRVLVQLGLVCGPGTVRIVQPGTDPNRFRPGLDTEAARARYDLESGRWLLTVARLVEHKSIDTAIRAFASLASTYPDLRYAVAGEGEIRPSLEELARSLGVGDRVRFLGGVPDSLLPNLINCADVFVGVSREMYDKVEGFGISLVEASACGVPVVGGTGGGIPDAVRDGETGLLANGADPAAVAAAIERLLLDEALRASLGAGGRRAVETFYNWDRVTRDLRSIAAELQPARRK